MSEAPAAPDRVRPGAAPIGCVVLVAGIFSISCGKEGPPLPPLVRLPAAPVEITAERRGGSVDVRLVVPSANTDGTRPADIERVDVYALTGPPTVTDAQLIKQATKIGSVEVKAPRDPDATVESDEPVSDVETPEGPGLDQGAPASFAERLSPEAFEPANLFPGGASRPPIAGPLAGPPFGPTTRVYVGVGISTRGRRGPFSSRTAIPLALAPPRVTGLKIVYDENAIGLSWSGLPSRRPVQEAASGSVLDARLVGLSFPATAYNVYEIKEPAEGETERTEVRLTNPAVEETRYQDKHVEWAIERCYLVRAVQTYDRLALESDASPESCVTPVDTFPPKPPTNVQVVPSEGAISLIWQRGGEKDLAGFIVLRGSPPGTTMLPITPTPIQEASFTDKVGAGTRYVYAVQAVDKAGNRSEVSSRSEETEAR